MQIGIDHELRRIVCPPSNHYAFKVGDGWQASWLGAGRTLDYPTAISAMQIVEGLGTNPATTVGQATPYELERLGALAGELGLTLDHAVALVAVPV
jgi:hypothetical protein